MGARPVPNPPAPRPAVDVLAAAVLSPSAQDCERRAAKCGGAVRGDEAPGDFTQRKIHLQVAYSGWKDLRLWAELQVVLQNVQSIKPRRETTAGVGVDAEKARSSDTDAWHFMTGSWLFLCRWQQVIYNNLRKRGMVHSFTKRWRVFPRQSLQWPRAGQGKWSGIKRGIT